MDFPNNLPTSWNEVSVDQFLQLKSVEQGDFQTILSYRIDQLCILSKTSIEDSIWDEIDVEVLHQMIKKISFCNVQPNLNFKSELIIDSISYTFKGLNKLTLGEFIDLEYLFGINYLLKLPEICALLYRQTRKNEWGHSILEPRTYNETERAELFYSLKITEVYGIVQAYLTFKQQFTEAYESLFTEEDVEDIQEEEVIPTSKEERDATQQDKINKKWSWERIIYQYSTKTNMTFDQITELPLIFFFNQLSMFKELKL